ncbi:MAG: hypothetical protein GEU78_04615 [Actinobacteria bacterium]|nr:hypothetical protein [Actinomycetota bacterium]
MGTEMDHARCSELLPPYERGELTPAEAGAVRRHLQGCDECSRELVGVKALRAAAVEPLTDTERDRLHAAIAAGVADEPAQTVIVAPRRPLWARLGPALAGVATLVLIVVGVSFLGIGTGLDSADDSGRSAESAGEGSEAPAAAPEGEAGGGDPTVSAFYAGDIGTVTVSSLSRDTRRRRFEAVSDTTYTEADPEGTESDRSKRNGPDSADHLAALEAQADLATGRQIADCARSVEKAVPYETLPVYAATATLKGERVLLIGFNWTKNDGEKLGQFMLWAWPIGDCRVPLFYGSTTPPR